MSVFSFKVCIFGRKCLNKNYIFDNFFFPSTLPQVFITCQGFPGPSLKLRQLVRSKIQQTANQPLAVLTLQTFNIH